MRRILVIVFCTLALIGQSYAQTFEQFMEGAQLLSLGICRFHQQFVCGRVQKNEILYFVVYDMSSRPLLVLRESDSVVVWRAGVGV